jgi:hypothetical protein
MVGPKTKSQSAARKPIAGRNGEVDSSISQAVGFLETMSQLLGIGPPRILLRQCKAAQDTASGLQNAGVRLNPKLFLTKQP